MSDPNSTISDEDSGDAGCDPGASGAVPASGTKIDRFMVLGLLGVGGMGVVLSAYDPQLDRKVALKLLRGDQWRGARAVEGRAALLREAQAMARLSHPNVVTVHEVGQVEGRARASTW